MKLKGQRLKIKFLITGKRYMEVLVKDEIPEKAGKEVCKVFLSEKPCQP